MANAVHSVREQVIELEVGSEAIARALHAEVTRDFCTRMAPHLDDALSSICPEGMTLRVVQLEVELGALPREGFLAALAACLREKLQAAFAQLSSDEVASGAGANTAVRWLSADEITLERLSRFLALGAVVAAEPERGAQDLWLQRSLERTPEALWRAVQKLPPEPVARRLAEQFGAAGRRAVARWLGETQGFDLPQWLADVVELRCLLRATQVSSLARALGWLIGDSDLAVEVRLHERAFRAVLAGALRAETDAVWVLFAALALPPVSTVEAERCRLDLAQLETFTSRPLRHAVERSLQVGAVEAPSDSRTRESPSTRLAGEASAPARAVELLSPAWGEARGRSVASPPASPKLPESAAGASAAAVLAASLRDASVPATEVPASNSAAVDPSQPGAALDSDRPNTASETRSRSSDIPTPAGGTLWVAQAGLVIVWPFLARLFGALGLVREQRFIDDAARERAVLLSAYLADGRCEWGEQDLLLPKILCGSAWAEPVPTRFELREEEAREAHELLATVVGHWSALGSTSVAGLRQAFLSREGQLRSQESGFVLEIPRAGHDILLDRLPWGIGLVLLPWMQRPLHVEW